MSEAPGSGLPNAFRNKVFWKWAPILPRPLTGGVLTMLHAVGAASDAAGRLRFRDGKPIRIADLARAARCDVKDARRYLDALVAAGVLAVKGERGPGKRPLFSLVLTEWPDWDAAVTSLKESERKRTNRKTVAPWEAEDTGADFGGQTPEVESGGSPPNFEASVGEEFGGQTPERVRGAAPREFGGQTPEQPREPRMGSQERADVGGQGAGLARAPAREPMISNSAARNPEDRAVQLGKVRALKRPREPTDARDPIDRDRLRSCPHCEFYLDPHGPCGNPECPGKRPNEV